MDPLGKLELKTEPGRYPAVQAVKLIRSIMLAKGCSETVASSVAGHLVRADLAGVTSHGSYRVLEYASQFDSGYLDPKGTATIGTNSSGATLLDGGGGIGIPSMEMAIDHLISETCTNGISAIGMRNIGHTGRLGEFVETAAEKGCFCMIFGGGGRETWRQVAPYGGRKALLPTNPIAIGVPGGDQGPVVLDFATGAIAGGWIYAAHRAGASLPKGVLMAPDGTETTDPAQYFDGGAILPKGGALGYGLALVAEMLAEGMLGPSSTECNWLAIALDTTRYRAQSAISNAAEAVLAEIRSCPPARGFDRVEIPGERERQKAVDNDDHITLPVEIWEQINTLAQGLGVSA
jgi:LDH2 family malate/lactate/ureidoglycolate dehydrogenase